MAYTGQQAVIPLGEMGLLTDVPAGQVPRGALIRANNVSYETGAITKAPGSLRYNTQVLPSAIVAAIDYWPDVVTQRMLALCADGKLYKDIGDRLFSSAVAIAEDLGAPTPRSMFVEGGREDANDPRKLFLYTDGLNQLKVIEADFDELTSISQPAADWTSGYFPRFGFIHRNRHWAFMGQRAYASLTTDHEDFVSTGILTQPVFPGEGGDLIGGCVFKGRAFVFKTGGFVYFLDDTDSDSDNWVWRKLGSNFGLASPHAICEILDDLYAANEHGGITSYAATQAFGDIESADLLRILQIQNYIRNATSLSGMEVMHALYYAAKKQAFFTARTGSGPVNDTLIHVDFNKQNPRAALWPKDSADCLFLRKDTNGVERPAYGSSDGYIYLMDREDRLVGGSAFTGEFMIGHTDMRFLDETAAHRNKIFDFLSVEFKPQGMWTLEVDVYIDGDFSETISYYMDVRDDGLDDFTLDQDILGREENQTITKPLHGMGRKISFHCRQAGSNQNFEIASFTVGFRVSDNQAVRI